MGKGGDSKVSQSGIQKPAAGDPAATKSANGANQSSSKHWVAPCSQWTQEEWNTAQFPTIGELRALIPKHCFERSALRGFAYIARDLLFLGLVVAIARACGLSSPLPKSWAAVPLWWLGWWAYWIAASVVGAGLWVLGHECGHGAFSSSPLLNDCVGFVLHTLFLVPYFSWQYSHAKHHRRTNDLVDGETHVPQVLDDQWCQVHKRLHDDLPLSKQGKGYFYLLWTCSVGIYMYFFAGVTGGRIGNDGKPLGKDWPDHYRLQSRLYPSKMKLKVLLSNLGIVAWMAVLYQLGTLYGFSTVIMWYSVPNFIVNNYLLVISTWMHHTHVSVPHFGPGEWNFVKGALLGTIDRPYGGPLDSLTHCIGSTHVCHHLFHELPFYHAEEATAALRAYLEPKGMYNYDPTSILRAPLIIAKYCHFVDGTDGIQYYKSFMELDDKKEGNKID